MMELFQNQESKQIQFHRESQNGKDQFPIIFDMDEIVNIEGNGFGVFRINCKSEGKWYGFYSYQSNLISEIIEFLQEESETNQLILFHDDSLIDEFNEGIKKIREMTDLHDLWINENIH